MSDNTPKETLLARLADPEDSFAERKAKLHGNELKRNSLSAGVLSSLVAVRTSSRRVSRKKRHGECCYCGAPASTVDHVPTRKLFPEPRPSDLITVPSCHPCNNRLSAQEVYVVHVLLSHREADTPVAWDLRNQLF